MNDSINHAAEQQELNAIRLGNGLRCIFVQDPQVEDVFLRVSVCSGFSSEPVGLCGLARLTMELAFRGSRKFPGPRNFKEFIEQNEIGCQTFDCVDSADLTAFIPEYLLEKMLERITDAFENPDFTKEAVEYAKQNRFASFYHYMRDDKHRLAQISIMSNSTRAVTLGSERTFKRKDLITRAKEFYTRHFVPENMILVMVANMSSDVMHDHIESTLGKVESITSFVPMEPSSTWWKDLRSGTQMRYIEAFTKNEQKVLEISFTLPYLQDTSSALYFGYLLSTSQPGSLKYFLKNEGLIKEASAQHTCWDSGFQCLRYTLYQTDKGGNEIERILSYMMGYLEILRSMSPQKVLFQQAREYYTLLYKNDDSLSRTERILTELRIGGNLNDLRSAEIPHKFDPESIIRAAGCLRQENCMVISLSDEHVNTQMHPQTDYYLQFSTFTKVIVPKFDGLSQPTIDPLLVTSRSLPTFDTDMDCVSDYPLVYLRPQSKYFQSTFHLNMKSSPFSKFSLPARRIYASLIRHKLWVLGGSPIFDVKVYVTYDSLNIVIKSAPDSLPRIVFLLVRFLTTPLGSEYSGILAALKSEEERFLDICLSGDSEFEYDSRFGELYESSNEPNELRLQLEQIIGFQDLPTHIQGKSVILFGGSINRSMALAVSNITRPLFEHNSNLNSDHGLTFDNISYAVTWRKVNPKAVNISSSEKKCVQTRLRYASCIKWLDIGVFSHANWATLLVFKELVSRGSKSSANIDSVLLPRFNVRAARRNGNIWLVVSLSACESSLVLEDRLIQFIVNDIKQVLNYTVEESIKHIASLTSEPMMRYRASIDEEMERIWEPLCSDPTDKQYFIQMQLAFSRLTLYNLRTLHMICFSERKLRESHTVLLQNLNEGCVNKSVGQLEVSLLGIYQPMDKNIDVSQPNNINIIPEIAECMTVSAAGHITKSHESPNFELEAATAETNTILNIIAEFS